MAKVSYTQKTLAALRQRGLRCAVVERWNQNVHRGDGGFGIRQDLFGWIDIIALDPERGIVGVQSTSQGQLSAHLRKLLEDRKEELAEWSRCNGIIEVWSWKKVAGRWRSEVMVIP